MTTLHNRHAFSLLALFLAGWWLVCSALLCFWHLDFSSAAPQAQVESSAMSHGDHQAHSSGHALHGDQSAQSCCDASDHQSHDMASWVKQQSLWLGVVLSALLVWGYALWSAVAARYRTRPSPVFRLDSYPRLHLTFERLLN